MLRSAAALITTAVLAVTLAASPAIAQPTGVELPANWRELIDSEMRARLKDPASAIVELKRGPRYADHKIDLQKRLGWAVCYSINAKNSYGGYTGASTEVFVVTPGGTVTWVNGDNLRSRYAAAVTRDNALKECARPGDPPAATPNPKSDV